MKVFISYSHLDKSPAGDILELLTRNGIECFFDEKDIAGREDVEGSIFEALASIDSQLVLVSRNSLESRWVRAEMAIARRNRKRIVLLLLADELDLPVSLRHLPRYRYPADADVLASTIDDMEVLNSQVTVGKATWNISTYPTPHFTGRERELNRVRQSLTEGHILAISGAPGVGKTQITLEYIYKNEGLYGTIWWIRANTSTSFELDIALFAKSHGIALQGAADSQITLREFKRWLTENTEWLLVFDDAVSQAAIKEVLPGDTKGHVLITSRHRDWLDFADCLELQPMSEAESSRLLMSRSLDLPARREDDAHEEVLNTVAGELSYLPLALAQAASFVVQNAISFQDYLEKLKRRKAEVLEQGILFDYDGTMFSALDLSIDRVSSESAEAVELLGLLSYVAPESFPLDAIGKGSEWRPDGALVDIDVAGEFFDFASGFLHAAKINQFYDSSRLLVASDVLEKYSLIRSNGREVFLHSLIQDMVRTKSEQDGENIWLEAAVRILSRAFDFHRENLESWKSSSRLVPHVLSVCEHALDRKASLQAVCVLLNAVGVYLHEVQGSFGESEAILVQAIALAESLGPKYESLIASSANNLGCLYKGLGRLREAEIMLRRAFEVDNSEDNATDRSKAINNLAEVYRTQGDCERAIPLFHEALRLDESVDPNGFSVARDLNNLALALSDVGQVTEAEALHLRANGIWEKLFGGDHPVVAQGLNNLAFLLQAQEKYSKSEPLYERALDIRLKTFGENHQQTVESMKNLAELYRMTGDYERADNFFAQALESARSVFGEEHQEVAVICMFYGLCKFLSGEIEEAVELLDVAVEIRSKTSVEEDHVTNSVRGMLSILRSGNPDMIEDYRRGIDRSEGRG